MIILIVFLIIGFYTFITSKLYSKVEVEGYINTIIELDNVKVNKLYYKCTNRMLNNKQRHIAQFNPISTNVISGDKYFIYDKVNNYIPGANIIQLRAGDEVTVKSSPGKKDIGDIIFVCI